MTGGLVQLVRQCGPLGLACRQGPSLAAAPFRTPGLFTGCTPTNSMQPRPALETTQQEDEDADLEQVQVHPRRGGSQRRAAAVDAAPTLPAATQEEEERWVAGRHGCLSYCVDAVFCMHRLL